MEVRYFDTSVVLSLLLSDRHNQSALEVWEGAFERVSSSFLMIEGWVNFHKQVNRLPPQIQPKWSADATKWLLDVYAQLVFHHITDAVWSEIKSGSVYGNVRTLDAIHLATAAIFSRESDSFSLASFDRRMRDAAKEMGFVVLPESMN